MTKMPASRTLVTPKFSKVSTVRYVLVGSSKGVYGGPFDTTIAQHRLLPTILDFVIAGAFENDIPNIESENVFFHRVRHLFGSKTFLDVSSLDQIKSLWKVAGAGLVHISFARGIGPMALLLFCRVRGAKTLLQTHGMLTSRKSRYHAVMDSLLTRPLIPSNSIVVALTAVEERDLLVWCPKLSGQTRVIGNPVATLPPVKLGTPVERSALFVARLHPRKDVRSFGVAARISERHGWTEKYQVLGPDEGDLSELLSETDKLRNFEYLGSTNQAGVVERLISCGVFVLTSRDEPWGNVLVSAISLGKPVVVTASSALADLIQKYGAGVVVSDGDANAIAEAVHHLLEENNYEQYSRNAIRCGKAEFENAIVKDKWLKIYKELGLR